jgi:hypothetical protein
VKARDSQRAALQYLIRLTDEMDISDKVIQEERKRLLALVETVSESFAHISAVSTEKIKQAECMEEEATKARTSARKSRTRMAKKRQLDKDFWVLRLPDSGVGAPLVYGEEHPVVDAATLIKEPPKLFLPRKPQSRANLKNKVLPISMSYLEEPV